MMPVNFYPLDNDTERRRALAKIYSLLIKLTEEIENASSETNQGKEDTAPLKQNIPPGQ
ncbi:MAG: hypothetical protein HY867_03280 [Chloroflexi bacterium]|nr:hypothetical protein [Chloroflexota bacterium]